MKNDLDKELLDKKRKMPLYKRFIKLVGRCAFVTMRASSKFITQRTVDALGSFFGSVFYAMSSRYRKVALSNLEHAYGDELSAKERINLAKDVFNHFTRGAFEFFRCISLSREQIDDMVELEGFENLTSVMDEGKGCIIVTAHYGNWEMLARKIVICGYDVNVIARDSDDPGMTGIANSIRENAGYKVFDRGAPLIGAFRALKRNEILGILPDQNFCGGLFVDFFGRPAATASGPAVLSLKSGAPIVPAFARRLPNGKYHAFFYPKIDFTPTNDYDKDVKELTALVTKAIELEIRKYPSQWLWLHNRWKLTDEAPSNE